MLRRALKAALWLVGLGVVAYLFFFVPLGRRTLWEHATRIAATDEARELGEDVDTATGRVGDAVQEELRETQRALDAGE